MDIQAVIRDAVILLLLFMLNGFFAMGEMAVVSSRRARLKTKADEGKKSYLRAMKTSEDPSSFLSGIQIWITLIGTLSGAFGGATIAQNIARLIAKVPFLARYASTIGLAAVVIIITFVSIIVGELVPKRIALSSPERIAAATVGPIRVMAAVFRPLEKFLSAVSSLVMRILGVKLSGGPSVTEEEIRIMIQEGTQSGAVGKKESDMVEGVFYLGDRRVSAFVTHRSEVAWIEASDGPERVKETILAHPELNEFPVCRGGLDDPVGMVGARDLLAAFMEGRFDGLRSVMRKPVFIPETMTALKAFEAFKANGVQTLLVLDEYGGMHGLLTQRDLVEEIVGELSLPGRQAEPEIVQRQDGSYLVDGMMNIDGFREFFDLERLLPESRGYHTLAGFILELQGSIPRTGETMEWEGYRFEIVDMDLNRIDKVLVRIPQVEPEVPEAEENGETGE